MNRQLSYKNIFCKKNPAFYKKSRFFTTVQFVKKQDFYIKKQLIYKNIFL